MTWVCNGWNDAMIIDRSLIEDYPFHGTFTRMTVDETKPLEERDEVEVTVLDTECDIQEASHTDVAYNNVTFAVYFPFSVSDGVDVRRGDRFEGNMYGVEVKGEVSGIFPTQLGGCEVHLKDFTV